MKPFIVALAIAPVYLTAGELFAAEEAQRAELSGPSIRIHSSPFQAPMQESGEPTAENRLFVIESSGGQSLDRIRERLEDPEQRKLLRAEHRAMLAKQYPDIAEELGIDSTTKTKLFELMTDEHISNLEHFSNPGFERATQERADAETKRLAALRELLGADGFEKLYVYLATGYERAQVARLDALMDPADKLQPEQKRQLIELYAKETRRRTDQHSTRGWSVRSSGPLPNPEELRRQSQLMTIAANEEELRVMMASHPEFERRAAQFLLPSQLDVLVRENRQQVARLKSWIESARRDAGLDATTPARADPALAMTEPTRRAIDGMVAFDVDVSINGEQYRMTHTGENGKPFDIEASDELWIRATPTVYDDYWLDVQLEYLERTAEGQRALSKKTGFGSLLMMPDGTRNRGGMTSDVVTGRKGYAVELVMNAEPLQ